MTNGQIDRAETAAILAAVTEARFPKLALPTIASNHQLTMSELQALLQRHGYPDLARMRRRRAELLDPDVLETPPDAPQPPQVETQRQASPAPAVPGEPYIAALPVDGLFVDPAYQRDLDDARVQRMVRAYNPALVGIVEVSHRPGQGYAILDGQHRWAATRDHLFETTDSPHIACRVHVGLTVDDEAKLYHQLNTTRKQLTGWDRWKARRSSGDENVTAIEAIATAAGYTISYRSATRGHITSTKSCEDVYKLGQAALLTEVLDVLRSAYRDDPDGVTGGIIHGLGHVLTHYDRVELDTHRLVGALTGIVPRQLKARAEAAREIHKGTVDKLTAHLIVELYNQAARAGQLEPFFTRVRPQTANKGTQRATDVEHARKVRAWAIEQGLIRPSSTHAPKDVYAAYAAAHPDENRE